MWVLKWTTKCQFLKSPSLHEREASCGKDIEEETSSAPFRHVCKATYLPSLSWPASFHIKIFLQHTFTAFSLPPPPFHFPPPISHPLSSFSHEPSPVTC